MSMEQNGCAIAASRPLGVEVIGGKAHRLCMRGHDVGAGPRWRIHALLVKKTRRGGDGRIFAWARPTCTSKECNGRQDSFMIPAGFLPLDDDRILHASLG